jgi:hypothetical protein
MKLNAMKLYKLFLLSIFGFVACTSDEGFVGVETENDNISSTIDLNRRSYAEAIEIAQNSVDLLNNGSSTRGENIQRKLDLKSGVKVFRQSVTRSNGETSSNDTLLYIFNFNDNLGFAVVSASRQTNGLIAVTESGQYDPDVLTGNVAFDTYMNVAKAYVAYEDQKPITDESVVSRASTDIIMCKPVYDTTYYSKIEPRVNVKWGQTGIIGQYCSNGYSGCSNTAAAQIMTYYKYPLTLSLTYSGKDVSVTSLDWDAIGAKTYVYYAENSDDVDKQVGRLARQLGQLAGSSYDADGTGTVFTKSRAAFKTLGYNVGDITDYNYENNAAAGFPLSWALNSDKLIYMCGRNSDDVGHAWIIDGCLYVKCKYDIMSTSDGETWTVYQHVADYQTCHNHINWGWDGAQNGYFLSTVFNAYKPLSKDSERFAAVEGRNLNFYDDVQYFTVWH